MARTAVPITEISRAGVAPPAETNGDATNGHSVANSDSKVFVLARNSGAGARTVTVNFPTAVDGQAVTPRTTSIPAGASRYFGPYPTEVYGSSLLLDVEHAEVKLSAFHLP